jgi:hypothetical protein
VDRETEPVLGTEPEIATGHCCEPDQGQPSIKEHHGRIVEDHAHTLES